MVQVFAHKGPLTRKRQVSYHKDMPRITFRLTACHLTPGHFRDLPTHPKAASREVMRRILAAGNEILG